MTESIEATKTCPHCAETILAEAKVCKHCGRDIDGKAVQVEDESQRRATGIILGLLLAAALVGILVFVVTSKSSVDCANDQAQTALDGGSSSGCS